MYSKIGDRILSISPKGDLYLHTQEDSNEIKMVSIIKITCHGQKIETSMV